MLNMPKINNIIYCVNHPDEAMAKADGFYALTKLTKEDKRLSFNPAAGVPVVIYVCPKCGYLEIYAAVMKEEWKNA